MTSQRPSRTLSGSGFFAAPTATAAKKTSPQMAVARIGSFPKGSVCSPQFAFTAVLSFPMPVAIPVTRPAQEAEAGSLPQVCSISGLQCVGQAQQQYKCLLRLPFYLHGQPSAFPLTRTGRSAILRCSRGGQRELLMQFFSPGPGPADYGTPAAPATGDCTAGNPTVVFWCVCVRPVR